MKSPTLRWIALMTSIVVGLVSCSPAVPSQTVDTGPLTVTGEVTYTNLFFTEGVAQPVVILEDQGGFVARDRKFLIPVESQVLAEITSDFYTSPFTYSLSLPAEPNGTLNDVDHDDKQETGVMIFAVAYWTNTWGDPFLERRDQFGGGWSTAYASTRVSDDRDSYLEVFGGKYLVYAPDDEQQFPSGFGEDQKLFTGDDPIMDLPAGWSVIDMDQTPFALDRSESPVIDLYEPESIALDDFSSLSYTEAFDKMVDKFKKEYAFTEFKAIDWDSKASKFRSRMVEAERAGDAHTYALTLRDFLWSIPDTHVGYSTSLLDQDFFDETAGGLGMAIRETDEGRVIVNFLTPGGPAEQAGILWGAEILSFDGEAIGDAIDSTLPWSSPFSNPIVRRLQQLRYATRFLLEKSQVEVKFINPGGSEQSAILNVVEERASFNAASFLAGRDPTALPVEFDVLPSGIGYIKISSFFDNDVLSILVWERALDYFIENEIPAVILDLRSNGGGSGWLADQMAAYFFDQEIVVGNTAKYNRGSGDFYMDPGDETRMIPPRAELQYGGEVVVLVGPACASACEFFSYDMTIQDRATILGQYPTEGAGGSVEDFLMPEDITVQLTIGRAVDAEGNIHLEGKGVVPEIKVPVTIETLMQQSLGQDVVLQAAVEFLTQPSSAGVVPSGPPRVGTPEQAGELLSSGAAFLEDLASESYDAPAFAQPGTVTYTIQLGESEPVIWGYVWCAADTGILEQNFENIQLEFQLDGTAVKSESFASVEAESGGNLCRLVYTSLSDWPVGEHHLSTTARFTAAINDGSADYQAGKYVLDYIVFVDR